MNPADARAFLDRDWDRLAALKSAHRVECFRAGGREATLRTAAALWAHARRVRPDWSDSGRNEDLAHHIELKRQIDRAAHALARR